MQHTVTVWANHDEVSSRVEFRRSSLQLGEGCEVMSLDVAQPEVAESLPEVEAADLTCVAVVSLGVPSEPGVAFRTLVPSLTLGLNSSLDGGFHRRRVRVLNKLVSPCDQRRIESDQPSEVAS